MLLPHRLVDFIVQIPNLEIAQARFLDLADFSGNLFEDLTAPLLTTGNGGDFGDEFGTACPACVDDAEGGSLLGAETEEHRLRFFGVACLDLGEPISFARLMKGSMGWLTMIANEWVDSRIT